MSTDCKVRSLTVFLLTLPLFLSPPSPLVAGDTENRPVQSSDEYRAHPAMVEPKPQQPRERDTPERGFEWRPALQQAGLFLGIQHSFRFATEPATRANLKGRFWRDYLDSADALRGWDDGDPHLVNYVGHPMMGAVTGFIQVQNDPRGRTETFGLHSGYWASRLKATAFSTAYSFQFELGPISESSLGNVGIDNKGHGAVDLVVTPTLGFAWQVTEDALDRFLISRLESRVRNRAVRIALRAGLNPSRSFANAIRFKVPWHRDNRQPGVTGW